MVHIDDGAEYDLETRIFRVDGVSFTREFISMFSRDGVESMRGFSFTLDWEENTYGGIARVTKTAIDIPETP